MPFPKYTRDECENEIHFWQNRYENWYTPIDPLEAHKLWRERQDRINAQAKVARRKRKDNVKEII